MLALAADPRGDCRHDYKPCLVAARSSGDSVGSAPIDRIGECSRDAIDGPVIIAT